jgi:hypothetical protein
MFFGSCGTIGSIIARISDSRIRTAFRVPSPSRSAFTLPDHTQFDTVPGDKSNICATVRTLSHLSRMQHLDNHPDQKSNENRKLSGNLKCLPDLRAFAAKHYLHSSSISSRAIFSVDLHAVLPPMGKMPTTSVPKYATSRTKSIA